MAKAPAVNPVKYIGGPVGYPSQSAMAPSDSGMPDIRPSGYDPGARLTPDIPASWKLTTEALASTKAQLDALIPVSHLFKDQVASLRQLIARHQAVIKQEQEEFEMQVPRIRAAARVTEAIRMAQSNGIDWEGALDDFLSAISGAV
jgi:hypothetical protein